MSDTKRPTPADLARELIRLDDEARMRNPRALQVLVMRNSRTIAEALLAAEADNAALRERLRLLEDAAWNVRTFLTGNKALNADVVGIHTASQVDAALADLAACLDAGDQPTKGE